MRLCILMSQGSPSIYLPVNPSKKFLFEQRPQIGDNDLWYHHIWGNCILLSCSHLFEASFWGTFCLPIHTYTMLKLENRLLKLISGYQYQKIHIIKRKSYNDNCNIILAIPIIMTTMTEQNRKYFVMFPFHSEYRGHTHNEAIVKVTFFYVEKW